MSTLKQQIQTDLEEALKTLDLEVMPARTFYGEILILFNTVGLFFWHSAASHKSSQRNGCLGKLFHEYREHASDIAGKMGLGCIVSSLVISLILLSRVKFYIVFKHQIREQLQTGSLLTRKIRQMAWIFYGLFALFIFPCTLFLNPDLTLFAAIIAFVFTGLISQFFINMELTRAGIVVMIEAIAALTRRS